MPTVPPILGFVLSFALCCSAEPYKSQPDRDGSWWLSINPDERSGFVDGYFDCYVFEYEGPLRFTRYSKLRYGLMTTGFYQRKSSLGARTRVIDVINSFSDPPGFKSREKGLEPAHGRRGGDDGLYWMNIGVNGTSRQLGLVEGYLDCHTVLNRSRGGTFSRAASYYPLMISRWYGIDESSATIDQAREDTSIAFVLYKFRDKEK